MTRTSKTSSLQREKLDWYFKRLKAMSAREVAYRVWQKSQRIYFSQQSADGVVSVGAQTSLPHIPGLEAGIKPLAGHPDIIEKWRTIAADNLARTPYLLGRRWPHAEGRDKWHLDPVSGHHWPSDIFCFSIDFRQNAMLGDPKYVWEMNRLQSLQPIAALGLIDNREELHAFCLQEIASWIDANPAFNGVNWSSGIELAMRIVSIAIVTTLVGEDKFDAALRSRIIHTLALHGFWIEKFLSLYSSANNHLIAEASGLFILGLLLPQLPAAEEWLRTGKDILERETLLQIHDDGVGVEQSITYSASTLEWLLLCAEIGKRCGVPLSGAAMQRLAACCGYLKAMFDARENHPRIGDEDEGRVLHFSGNGRDYTRTIVDYAASGLNRPELAPCEPVSDLGSIFFPPQAPGPAAPLGLRQFPIGGYTTSHQIFGGKEIFLVFDHAPLGYLSLAAHGHADTLAVWLHIDGRPVLVDAGTFTYNDSLRWRRHFKSTAAHNTLCIAEQSSSVMASSFNWSHKADVALLSTDDKGGGFIEAEHDGYQRRFGVLHRRSVAIEEGRIVITDRLVGGKGRIFPVSINWLIHPDLTAAIDARDFVISDGNRVLLRIQGEGGLAPHLFKGEENPPRGWYSESFGKKVATFQCSFGGKLPGDATFRTVLSFAL